jgi:hypothetical protein
MFGASVRRLVPLALAAACAYNPAPKDFLPGPKEADRDLYGAWIELTVPDGRRERVVSGELIAVRPDSVWFLPDTGAGVVGLATAGITQGQMAWYHSEAGAVAGYSALGIVSTISNGVILILTAPAWLITGIVATSNESGAPIRKSPRTRWADLAPYARFPGGMPQGIDVSQIRRKP